jgi:hypothetical protein
VRMAISREEAVEMAAAHAEGWHSPPDGFPREGCPECDDRPLATYATADEIAAREAD